MHPEIDLDLGGYDRARSLPALMVVPLEWIERQGSSPVDLAVIQALSEAACIEISMRDSGNPSFSPARLDQLSDALRAELAFYDARHLTPRYASLGRSAA